MKTICFPGWALPADRGLFEKILPDGFSPIDVVDYGFFSGTKAFDFKRPDEEIAKFASGRYEAAVGYSLGSQMALRMAINHPESLRCVVIICGFAKFADGGGNIHGQKSSALRAMIAGMRSRPAKVLKDFVHACFGGAGPLLASSLIPSPSALTEGLDFLLNCDLRSQAKLVKAPTLVIAAQDDTVVKPELCAELACLVSDGKFVLEKGHGHSLPFSALERVRALINEFIYERNII